MKTENYEDDVAEEIDGGHSLAAVEEEPEEEDSQIKVVSNTSELSKDVQS